MSHSWEEAQKEIVELREMIVARNERVIELENWSGILDLELAEINSSRAYRLATWLRGIRLRIAPPGSRRAVLERLAFKVARKVRQGPKAFSVALVRRLMRRGPISRLLRAMSGRADESARARGAMALGLGVPGHVSVILPVYNQAHLLAESIESVLKQTYLDFELIVLDDGSSDGVKDVLARYLDHPKVRILTQTNQQLPKALSNGFEFARGEFWTWTSADNLMHPEQLTRQVAFLRSHPQVAMVYADYVAINDQGKPLRDPSFRPHNRRHPTSPEIHLPHDPREVNVESDNFIGPCFLYRNTVGKVIGEYDPNLGLEDYDYWMRVNHAFVIEHLGTDETLYSYRVHDHSLSGRAAALGIIERVGSLLQYERDRHDYYRKTWTLAVDAAMKARLAGCTTWPHQHVDLGSACRMSGHQGPRRRRSFT